MSSHILKPQEIKLAFIQKSYELIYYSTALSFRQKISMNEFIDIAKDFNHDIKCFEMTSTTNINNIETIIWMDETKSKAMSISFNTLNEIESIYMKSFITYPETDRLFTENNYNMPIKDDWYVYWGGTNAFMNYHYPYVQQRYAFDFIKTQKEYSYSGSPLLNESYFAFNQDIYTPADGKVVELVQHITDNIPGEKNEENHFGNYIIIRHPNDEYSIMAHLKAHSIQVKVGEKVQLGEVIAKCGNSGNSSEPHLHFQVSDSPDFIKGKSLRIRFDNGLHPIKGNTIFGEQPIVDDRLDTLDKIDLTLSFGEVLLFVPRWIFRFIKDL